MFSKLSLPAVAFSVGVFAGMVLQHKFFFKPCPDLQCAPCPKPEVQSIDFEKVKNFKGSIVLHQHYHVEANGDSIFAQSLRDVVKTELSTLKVSRCK